MQLTLLEALFAPLHELLLLFRGNVLELLISLTRNCCLLNTFLTTLATCTCTNYRVKLLTTTSCIFLLLNPSALQQTA